MVQQQTREFLKYFGEIEKELGKITGLDNGHHTTFTHKIEKARKRVPVIRRYETELKTFGDLRNLLSHNNDLDIAVPSEKTVKRIERIWRHLVQPVTAMDVAHKNVSIFQDTDTLVELLKTMDENKYTHFPIYHNQRYLGLLTDNGLAYWLARHRDRQISLENVFVKDVFDDDEKKKNYRFVARKESIFDVDDYFKDPLMEALFVTENGKPTETILGIITGWDILSHQINGDG